MLLLSEMWQGGRRCELWCGSATSRVGTCVAGFGLEAQNFVLRRIYPFVVAVNFVIAMLSFQIRQFRRLYNHIKDDK